MATRIIPSGRILTLKLMMEAFDEIFSEPELEGKKSGREEQ
jgi:hypothetical protein